MEIKYVGRWFFLGSLDLENAKS